MSAASQLIKVAISAHATAQCLLETKSCFILLMGHIMIEVVEHNWFLNLCRKRVETQYVCIVQCMLSELGVGFWILMIFS